MSVPYRRCGSLDSKGLQCENWFPAEEGTRFCVTHQLGAKIGIQASDEQKARYIDLVNEQREYCYHFLDGSSQDVDRTLIFEFKDNESGTRYEKLDRHIAFLEKALEDVKARLFTSKAVKREDLDKLTEEERAELRKIKVTREVQKVKEKKVSVKSDPLKHLMQSRGMSESDAKSFLNDDIDELMAKYKAAKESK
jgi:hypothetical protein